MIAAFSITPVGTAESVGDMVAEAVKIVRDSGLPCETNALFTNLEGSWDDVLAVIKECTERLSELAPRLSVLVKLDVHAGMPAGELTNRPRRIDQRLAPG
jgi:uncharacterized protein (TIGR00106 family)